VIDALSLFNITFMNLLKLGENAFINSGQKLGLDFTKTLPA
jgi:hypothetical protein